MFIFRDDFVLDRTTRWVWQNASVSNGNDHFDSAKTAVENCLKTFSQEISAHSTKTFEEVKPALTQDGLEIQKEFYKILAVSENETDVTKKAKEEVFIVWLDGIIKPIFASKTESWCQELRNNMLVFGGLEKKNILDESGATDNDKDASNQEQDILSTDDILQDNESIKVLAEVKASLNTANESGVVPETELQETKDQIKKYLESTPGRNIKSHIGNLLSVPDAFLVKNPRTDTYADTDTYTYNDANWKKWVVLADNELLAFQGNPPLYTAKKASLDFYKESIKKGFQSDESLNILSALPVYLSMDGAKIDAMNAQQLTTFGEKLGRIEVSSIDEFYAYGPSDLLNRTGQPLPSSTQKKSTPAVLQKSENLFQHVKALGGLPEIKAQGGSAQNFKVVKDIYATKISEKITEWLFVQRQKFQTSNIKPKRFVKGLGLPQDLQKFAVVMGYASEKFLDEMKAAVVDTERLIESFADRDKIRQDLDDIAKIGDSILPTGEFSKELQAIEALDFRTTSMLVDHINKLDPVKDAVAIAQLKKDAKSRQSFEHNLGETVYETYGLSAKDAANFSAWVAQTNGFTETQLEPGEIKNLLTQWDGTQQDQSPLSGMFPGLGGGLKQTMRQVTKVWRWMQGMFPGFLGTPKSFKDSLDGASSYLTQNIDDLGNPPVLDPEAEKKQQESLKKDKFTDALKSINNITGAGPDLDNILVQTFLPAYKNIPQAEQDDFWKNLSGLPRAVGATDEQRKQKISAVRNAIFESELGPDGKANWEAFKAKGLDKAFTGFDFMADPPTDDPLTSTPTEIINTLIKPSTEFYNLMDANASPDLLEFITEKASTSQVSLNIWGQLSKQLNQLVENTKDQADDQDKFSFLASGAGYLQLDGLVTKKDGSTVNLNDNANKSKFQLKEWKDGDSASGLKKLIENISKELDISDESLGAGDIADVEDKTTAKVDDKTLSDKDVEAINDSEFPEDETKMDGKQAALFKKAQETSLLKPDDTNLLTEEVKEGLNTNHEIRRDYLKDKSDRSTDENTELAILKEEAPETPPEGDDVDAKELEELSAVPGAKISIDDVTRAAAIAGGAPKTPEEKARFAFLKKKSEMTDAFENNEDLEWASLQPKAAGAVEEPVEEKTELEGDGEDEDEGYLGQVVDVENQVGALVANNPGKAVAVSAATGVVTAFALGSNPAGWALAIGGGIYTLAKWWNKPAETEKSTPAVDVNTTTNS